MTKSEERIYKIEKEFGHLIKDIVLLITDGDYFKLIIYLNDGSNLRVTEEWKKEKLISYSYYWLDEKNRLKIGRDNAPHHKKISTFPHHKHMGRRATLSPSQERSLEEVIRVIENSFT